MNYLSACTVVRNETPFIVEWLEFHRIVGFEHFYIYDDASDIPVRETLARDIELGDVEVYDALRPKAQINTFGRCLEIAEEQTHWLAFIDADEYLFPTRGTDIRPYLKDYDYFGALAVNWLTFGTSGHDTRPEGLVTENYVMRTTSDAYINTHVKSIVHTYTTDRCNHPHIFPQRHGHFTVNENFEEVKDPWHKNSTNIFRINHYWTKSREDFKAKLIRGRNDNSRPIEEEELELLDRTCNIKDTAIHRFLPRLKNSISQRGRV